MNNSDERKTSRKRKSQPSCEGPVCKSDPYPRLAPGEYLMRCLAAACYPDPQYKRGVCRLAFSSPLVHEGVTVYGFINLGDGTWCLGRRTRYWRAWTLANGAQPRRGQKMTARIFVNKWFKVSIGDVVKDADGKDHSSAQVYSTVHEILELAHE